MSKRRAVLLGMASPEEHMQRVINQGDLRPMADNDDAMNDLKRILREREPFYSKAHTMIDTSHRNVENCVENLVKMLSGAVDSA